MATLMHGQTLRGRLSLYTVTKQLQDCIWLARYMTSGFRRSTMLLTTSRRSQNKETVVVKSVGHFRIHNERDILLHFQNKTNLLRPLVDKIEHSARLK